VRTYKWNKNKQITPTILFQDLLRTIETGMADLIKMDVEGYEYEVVSSMIPSIREGRVKAILLDYHQSILESRNIVGFDIHKQLLAAGMSCKNKADQFSGHFFYEWSRIS
jgi:hypothetical protein